MDEQYEYIDKNKNILTLTIKDILRVFVLFNYVVVMKVCDGAEDLGILLNGTPEDGQEYRNI